MSTAQPPTLRPSAKRSVSIFLMHWHRTIGLFAAGFLLVLALTGLLLMHTDELNLDDHHIDNSHLLDWYGIRPAPPPLSFAVSQHWITQAGDRLYFDTQFVSMTDGLLIGAVPAGDEILVATTAMLLLLTSDGNVAERLGATAGVPPDLTHIGIAADQSIIVRAPNERYVFDPLIAQLRVDTDQQPVRWHYAAAAPQGLLRTINRRYRGAGLSLERIIVDLHTGRLFGTAGVVLINLASIALVVLILSGIVLWWRRAHGDGANGTNG